MFWILLRFLHITKDWLKIGIICNLELILFWNYITELILFWNYITEIHYSRSSQTDLIDERGLRSVHCKQKTLKISWCLWPWGCLVYSYVSNQKLYSEASRTKLKSISMAVQCKNDYEAGMKSCMSWVEVLKHLKL